MTASKEFTPQDLFRLAKEIAEYDAELKIRFPHPSGAESSELKQVRAKSGPA